MWYNPSNSNDEYDTQQFHSMWIADRFLSAIIREYTMKPLPNRLARGRSCVKTNRVYESV